MAGWRMRAVAAVVAVVTMTPAGHAAEPAVLARAGFGLVGNAERGYVATFTIRKQFTAGAARLDMISEVFECDFDADGCELVSQQIDVLPDRAFVASSDLSASLSTTWAGKPLRIDWRRGGRGLLQPKDRTLVFVGTNHQEAMEDYRALNAVATARSLLGGSRGCSDVLGATVAATWSLGSDALARVGGYPRADAVPGLAAAHGRCYVEAQRPASVSAALTDAQRVASG